MKMTDCIVSVADVEDDYNVPSVMRAADCKAVSFGALGNSGKLSR